jgi:hypothetical protein
MLVHRQVGKRHIITKLEIYCAYHLSPLEN